MKGIDVLLAEARHLVDTGALDEARRTLEAVAEWAFDDPAVLYLLGFITLGKGEDPGQAISLLSRALDAGYDPYWVHYVRSQAFLRAGDLAAAEQDLRAAAALRPDDAGVEAVSRLLERARSSRIERLSAQARQSPDSGDHEAALKSAQAVLALDANDAFGNYCTAFALQSLGKEADAALAAYQRALDAGFDPFWVHYNRSRLHLSMGKLRAAIEDLWAVARLGIAAVRKRIGKHGR
jgi:tetratricopeptide (TPR) repeat protein